MTSYLPSAPESGSGTGAGLGSAPLTEFTPSSGPKSSGSISARRPGAEAASALWAGPVLDPNAAVVVLAGGSGVRAGAGRNKVYLPIAGRTIVARSLATMAALPGLRRLVLVIRPEDHELAQEIIRSELHDPPVPVEFIPGGPTRHASEEQALHHLADAIHAGDLDVVLIHDAARPFGSRQLAADIARTAARHGGAVPGVPADDLAAISPDGSALSLAPDHIRVQTPQGFAAGPLLAAYRAAAEEHFTGTDTSACVARFTEINVQYVPGESQNFKITHPEDLYLAEQLLLHYGPSLSVGK